MFLNMSYAFIGALILVFTPEVITNNGKTTWSPSLLWGECSQPCDEGIEKRIFYCLKIDKFNSGMVKKDSDCGSLEERQNIIKSYSKEPINRTCNWGDCQRKVWWKVSKWNPCSQPCGNIGFTTRDVDCIMNGTDGEIKIGKQYQYSYCSQSKKPKSRSMCNHFNCPAEFQAMGWKKCEQSDPCKNGLQTREWTCRSMTLNGNYINLPRHACYMGNKAPPSLWRRCFIPEISGLCTLENPVIEENKITVVQMRNIKKMQLRVGENAYILPSTRISIKCPVKYFPIENIIWKHSVWGEIRYIGQTKNNIFMRKSGHLVIRNFKNDYKGEWSCHAGNVSASIFLHYNQPSSGFYDWERRNSLRANDMMNEDPAVVMSRQVHVQWAEGPWSNCSVPCGGKGIQTRKVHCEQMDTVYYHILDDNACKQKLLSKPKTERVCVNLPKCPSWKLINVDKSQCTEVCSSIGKGTVKSNLICALGDQELPAAHCESFVKPDISCPNEKCQIAWKLSDWSKCSVTCGGTGLQYRESKCVWINTGTSAGSLCYDVKLEIPDLVKSCTTKPCKLDCVDLFENCGENLHWCRYTLRQHQCCKSCRKYAIDTNRLLPIPSQ